MSPSAMPSASSPRRSRRGGSQDGISLITTIALTGILAMLVLASLSFARSANTQTARTGRTDIALQVADAGVNQYISRLVEDPRYYDHWVDPAEDPRIDPYGAVHAPGTAWTPGVSWTYAGPSQTWTQLQDARFGKAAYSLRITPPPSGSDLVTVQSTGQAGRTDPNPVTRSVQSQIHPTSIADFQIISNATIHYGSAATTTGKLYSAVDINHEGVATAPAYAAHFACSTGSTTGCNSSSRPAAVYQAGAYDSVSVPSFQNKFPTPIDFSQFTSSLLDIKDAATSGGTAYNDPTANAWEVQFLADGRARIYKITGTSDPGAGLTTIGCPTTINVPANGAMYFEQSVIVSDGTSKSDSCNSTVGPRASTVNGRVTIATKGNVYVGGNISYASSGDDVLGLIAANEVIITKYTPSVLTWRAASLAQSGQWRTYQGNADGAHSSMTYTGSQTTADGGYASMFNSRTYQYDDTLQRLRPPFYPILEGSWQTYYWREVTPPA